MGFLNWLLGIDRTVEQMAVYIHRHLLSLNDLESIEQIKEYLDKSNIKNVVMQNGPLKWELYFKTKDTLTLRYYKEDKMIIADFGSLSNSPLSDLTLYCERNNNILTYSTSQYYKKEHLLPEIAQLFIKNLEKLCFKNGLSR